MSNTKQFDYLVNLMAKIAGRNELSDVTLVAQKDTRKFPVHRLVLRAASEYFDALLGPNFREHNESNIVLKGIDGPTLRTIVHYIYHGDITIDEQNVDAIIDAATSMQLIELAKQCVQFKFDNLNTLNCVGTLLIADKYQLMELKSMAFNMIRADYEIIPNEQIAEIDETSFRELLKNDQLSATESAIFTGLVDWLSANNVEESDDVACFLKLVRLKHIGTQALVNTVEPFFVKHNQSKMISDEYRNRILRPNVKISSRRINNIYHLVQDSKLTITKYDQSTDKWTEFKKIDFQSSGFCFSAIVAENKLYLINDRVCAYDLSDFSRIELPNMNEMRRNSVSVVAGNFIYAFGGIQNSVELKSCERFDIGNQVWTIRNNMPISTHHMDAIEHNRLIYVAFNDSHRTHLYCHNPEDDTWLHKISFGARHVVFAKTSSSLYFIRDSRVLHRFDPTNGAITEIGNFYFDIDFDTIYRTVELNGEIYLLGGRSFSKINLGEDVEIVKLKSANFKRSLCLYAQ